MHLNSTTLEPTQPDQEEEMGKEEEMSESEKIGDKAGSVSDTQELETSILRDHEWCVGIIVVLSILLLLAVGLLVYRRFQHSITGSDGVPKIYQEEANLYIKSHKPERKIPANIRVSDLYHNRGAHSPFGFTMDMMTRSIVPRQLQLTRECNQYCTQPSSDPAGFGRPPSNPGFVHTCFQTNLPLLFSEHSNTPLAFEVLILQKSVLSEIYIGIACRPYPSFRQPGWNKYSLSVSHHGRLYISGRRQDTSYMPSFDVADIIGMHIDPLKWCCYFTKNGEACAEIKMKALPKDLDYFITVGTNEPDVKWCLRWQGKGMDKRRLNVGWERYASDMA